MVLADDTVAVADVDATGSHKNSTICPTKIFPINEFRSAVSRLQARCTVDCADRILVRQFEEQEPDPPIPAKSLRLQLPMLL